MAQWLDGLIPAEPQTAPDAVSLCKSLWMKANQLKPAAQLTHDHQCATETSRFSFFLRD